MYRDTHRNAFATLLCLLGLWLQLMAPALALQMQGPRFDPRSTICHGASSNDGDHHGQTPRHAPACDHCPLCHGVTGGPAADERPAFTLLDYPDAAPIRWTVATCATPSTDPLRTAQPRAPPTPI